MERYTQSLVLGLGNSGASAARLLLSEGAAVTVVDSGQTPDLFESAHALELDGARVYLGATVLPTTNFDVCIVSPGISETAPWVKEMRKCEIPVISELELGWSRCQGKVLAVTGSNGKSTAVKWCAEALAHAGRTARIAGNYGPAVTDEVRHSASADVWVLEVSSFQLETVERFRPDVGVLLNVLPNHLNRHGSMEAYLGLKARLFRQMTEQDTCIVPFELAEQIREQSGRDGPWTTFGHSDEATYRYYDGQILQGECAIGDVGGTMFENTIMGPAAAAVFGALQALDVPAESAVDAARRLEPLPHRMQKLADLRGIHFINDSKATNLAALAAALRMTPGPIRLIAGGLAKEKDFSEVEEILAERAASVYLIGTASEDMASAWSHAVPAVRCASLDDAVRQAWQDAQAGETILLSPGCASFDQFSCFEDRGECFLGIVRHLVEEEQI